MGVRRKAAAVLVLLVGCGVRSDVWGAQELTLHYDTYYLALPVLSIEVSSRLEQAEYHTTVALRTRGLLALIAPWESTATAAGAVEGPALRPAFYRVASEFRDRRQRIDLAYEGDGMVRGEVVGTLTDGERSEVPDALRDGTIDPVTAAAVVARRLAAAGTCAGTLRIYDGLRRYDLHYDDLGTAELEPSRRDAYRGEARHCRATIEPVAGFLGSERDGRERATELSAWLAPPMPGATPVAVRIDLTGTRGMLHAHLARAVAGTP